MKTELYKFRLLKTGFNNGFYNMGLDEALLESVSTGNSLPVLRFYGWKPYTVSIGYFQNLEEEVNTEECAKSRIDIVRRISGGGAVFHHAEITYSIIIPVSHPLAGANIQESYPVICSGIIRGLSILGVSSRFVPINDILSEGKKISGNAQTRKKNCILQHGTILLDLDVDLMFEVLKVPLIKIKDKTDLIKNVKDRVTSLKTLLGQAVSYEEAETALVQGFSQALSLDFSAESLYLSQTEENRTQELALTKFASLQWLCKR